MATEVKLNEQEEKELREGQALYEMTQGAGFAVLKGWLTDMAFHSWADPRGTTNQEEWMWQELNAFYAANNAREILDQIQKAVNQSEYLSKKKSGEITNQRMRL
jgi:hypothetical protein